MRGESIRRVYFVTSRFAVVTDNIEKLAAELTCAIDA